MIKFDLALDYKVPEKEQDEEFSNERLTVNYIVYAVRGKYPDGLEGQRRRVWGRIQRKLDGVLENDENTVVELETAEVEFIKGLFGDETRFPAQASKYVMMLEDVIKAL